ncbi:hypothetical protein Tco_0306245 [Tanacetum coccineum]
MMRMTETDWLNLMLQVGSNPALASELLGADVTEENFIERMTVVKERKFCIETRGGGILPDLGDVDGLEGTERGY